MEVLSSKWVKKSVKQYRTIRTLDMCDNHEMAEAVMVVKINSPKSEHNLMHEFSLVLIEPQAETAFTWQWKASVCASLCASI